MTATTKRDILLIVAIIAISFCAGLFTCKHFTKPCPNVFTIKNGEVLDSSSITEHSKIETDWHIPQEVKTVVKKVPEYIIWDDDSSTPTGVITMSTDVKLTPQQYYYDTSTICKELSDKYNSLLQKYLTETSYTDTARDKNVSVIVDNKVKENKIAAQRITILDSLQKTSVFNIIPFNKIIGYYGFTGGWQNATKQLYLGLNLSLKLKNDNIIGLSGMVNNRLQSLYNAEFRHPIRLFKSKK